MRFLGIFCLTFLITACNSLDFLPMKPRGILLNDRTIVFDASIAPEFGRVVMDADESGYWTPSQAQIVALEEAVTLKLSDDKRTSGSTLEGYYRQYFGYSVNGQRRIYGAYFCHADTFDWQQNLVFVHDGGACFIDLSFEVDTGDFPVFYVHGEA